MRWAQGWAALLLPADRLSALVVGQEDHRVGLAVHQDSCRQAVVHHRSFVAAAGPDPMDNPGSCSEDGVGSPPDHLQVGSC